MVLRIRGEGKALVYINSYNKDWGVMVQVWAHIEAFVLAFIKLCVRFTCTCSCHLLSARLFALNSMIETLELSTPRSYFSSCSKFTFVSIVYFPVRT